jgi:cystathionine beta-lyase/cystathionine gamma-synthase
MEESFILNEFAENREEYFNAITPPIMQTSNFAFKKVEDLQKALEDEYSTFLYSRGHNPTIEILRKKLAALDQAEDCLVFNSGASAIFASVLANVGSGDHVISVQKPYIWAQKMFENILPRFNVTHTYVEGKRISDFENSIQDNTKIIYLESPNSWDFSLQDLSGIAKLAKSRNIVTICDNSYCTPIYQKPIVLGIDISIQSATKYIGGHSDVVGGVLSGKKAMIKKIFNSELLNMGNGINPFNAWLLIRGLRTLPVRLDRISKTTKQIISFLKNHKKVEKVIYPHDSDFPQYDLAKNQMINAGGLFTIVLQCTSRTGIIKFCEALNHFLLAVSWGGHESLVLPKCASIKDEDFDPENSTHRMVRLYIGLEDPEYLIKDLKQAFIYI